MNHNPDAFLVDDAAMPVPVLGKGGDPASGTEFFGGGAAKPVLTLRRMSGRSGWQKTSNRCCDGQKAMADADPKYMNQADYARHRSVVRSTITVWKNRGLLVWNEAGQIDVAQSDASIDARPKNYRGGSTKSVPPADGDQVDLFAEPPPPDLIPPIDANPDNWSTAVAIRVKETYAALSRKAEYEKTIGLLVSIDEVGKQVEAEYSVIRERLLTVPGKIAAGLVGLSAAEISEVILAEITEALSELHEPARHGDGGIGSGPPTAPGASGVPAAVAP